MSGVPKNPGFESAVSKSFARQSLMATLGVSIERIAPGECDLRLPYSPVACQQTDTDVLAVEFKINLLAPAQGDYFLARGRVLRAGRRLTVCQADVFAMGGAESLVATMLSTIIVKQKQQP